MKLTQSILLILFYIQILVISKDCPYPLLQQFITDYSMKLQDVEILSKGAFSKFTIPDVNASNGLLIQKIVINSTYSGSQRSVSRVGLKSIIANDGIKLKASYQINVTHTNPLIGKTTYKITTQINDALYSYTKQLNTQTGKSSISDLKVTLPTFKTTYDPTPSSTDAKKLIVAIDDNKTTSFYTSLSQYLSNKSLSIMNDNCKDQHISQIYPSGLYTYKYDEKSKIDFTMKTLSVSYDQQSKTLRNGLSGINQNQQDSQCTPGQPQYLAPYNSFVSKQFIQNMVKWSALVFNQFQNVTIDDRIRSNVFQFRLLDLEYVLPDALIKYKKNYLSKVFFKCAANQIGDLMILDFNTSYQQIKWQCNGFLSLDVPTKILDFTVTIRHTLYIRLSTSYFTVYSNMLQLIDAHYFQVDGMVVSDQDEAKVYIKQMFNDCRVYTVGTYFDTKKDNDMMKFTPQGIWIGRSQTLKTLKTQ